MGCRLHLDLARVGGARLFRPKGWLIALIADSEVRAALESIGATGLAFEPVG